jgi:hypothetical protein
LCEKHEENFLTMAHHSTTRTDRTLGRQHMDLMEVAPCMHHITVMFVAHSGDNGRCFRSIVHRVASTVREVPPSENVNKR